jgi:GNAT superfamily N-acetyltransferase
MTITIRKRAAIEILDAPNIADLLAEYAAESAIDGLGWPMAHLDTYQALDASGILHALGAFDGDTLVGFLFFIVSRLPHYNAQPVATSESFFVASTARKSGAGLKLLHEAEHAARELGAVGFLVSAPVGSRLESVLPAVSYREASRVFFRGLL